MAEITEDKLNPEEIELSKLLKEHEKIHNVLNLIQKQAYIKPESISLNTAKTVIGYFEILKDLKIEIKVLIKQNPSSIPDNLTIDDIYEIFDDDKRMSDERITEFKQKLNTV
jgi:superfamily I DNA and RNA helicase